MNNLRISLLGYGKMGKEVEKLAHQQKIEVVSVIDSIVESSLIENSSEDVFIDFTTSESVIGNIRKISGFGKNIVVGTTGWQDHLEEAKQIVESSKTGLIYSPNFSVGVYLYSKIVENALKLLNKKLGYKILAHEIHHEMKKDAPSGTAKLLERIIKETTGEEIKFSSSRGGYIPGTHIIMLDSEADTIELKHIARNRSGFASGALLAASWIKNKKGFYNMNDLMKGYSNGGK